MPSIIKDLTPVNFTKKNSRNILGVVMHSMAGTQAGSISWFKNSQAQASAHYCISKTGQIVQCVEDKDIAWHAGLFDEPIADWLKPNPNNVTIGIELEDEKNPNWNYPQAQKESLKWLIEKLCTTYNIPQDSAHILLHKNLNPSRRSDPVGNFDLSWVLPSNQNDSDWIIGNSDKWRGLVWYLELETNPEETGLDKVKSIIGGYKSRSTDLENQLKQANLEKELAITEVQNQKDKLANSMAVCQREVNQLKAEYRALKETLPDVEKLRGSYEGRITELEGSLREAEKAIGLKNLEITELKGTAEAISWLDKLIAWLKNRYK